MGNCFISGVQPLLPFAIAADIGWMTDYGMQVAMNYANKEEGWTGKDIWFKQIDWFDVEVSAVVGGITGGYTAEYKAAQTLGTNIGKFGTWVYNNRKLITLGEMALTSGVDITGEGFQKVEFGDFTQRFAINLTTFALSDAISGYTKKWVKNRGIESNFDAYMKSGSEVDRNGLTRSGRALQKHGSRSGSVFPQVSGKELNLKGQSILNDILNSSSKKITSNRFGGFDIFDLITGRGARFDSTNNFIGFLEP